MHHGNDLVEHRTREASFGAQSTNHFAHCTRLIKLAAVPKRGSEWRSTTPRASA